MSTAFTSDNLLLVTTEPGQDVPTRRMRQVRAVTLTGVAVGVLSSLVFAGVGLGREDDPLRIALAAAGLVLFTAALAGALYRWITPGLPARTQRALLAGFVTAAVLSVPLVAPLAADRWQTWAFVGATVVGTAPLLARPLAAVLAGAATVGVSAAVAWWVGGSVGGYAALTSALGLSVAGWNGLHVWLWTFLVRAQEGRAALARLAVTEERLRFARDVHDLLGHHLTVIALKAELAARLAPVDAGRAGREATEVQRLAVAALAEVREVVHGYRRVDFRDQLTAVEQVLRAAGVRCTVRGPGHLPAELADQLTPVLREASTNVIRHSGAQWCTIDIVHEGNEVRMTVGNDGADGTGPDRHSSGLRGLADRLAGAGGTLRTSERDGVFTLEAVARVRP